jgi:hypothetical protein
MRTGTVPINYKNNSLRQCCGAAYESKPYHLRILGYTGTMQKNLTCATGSCKKWYGTGTGTDSLYYTVYCILYLGRQEKHYGMASNTVLHTEPYRGTWGCKKSGTVPWLAIPYYSAYCTVPGTARTAGFRFAVLHGKSDCFLLNL